jgi:ribonuclease HII
MDYLYEENALKAGYKTICGIDEAGRGPLAGPVYAAAVILPIGLEIKGLNDSKKISEKKREQLFDVICENAVSYSIGIATEKEIDEINILNATFLAMHRAVEGLNIKPDYALIDGNQYPKIPMPTEETVVKGDAKSMSIAAASILAKVSRDRFMLEKAKEYPQYQFEKHKGYGTKLHYEMLTEFGPSPIHRLSFLKKFFGEK